MYFEITMSHCRIISRRKCRCICVSFLGNGVLKKFLMIISLFVGHMSPWHCFILKEIKRLFGVGLIVIKALFRYWWSKNARIFFLFKSIGHFNSIIFFCHKEKAHYDEILQISLSEKNLFQQGILLRSTLFYFNLRGFNFSKTKIMKGYV